MRVVIVARAVGPASMGAIMRRMAALVASKLVGAALVMLLVLPAQARDALVVRAEPGQNVTLHEAWNFRGTVWVRIVDARTGGPATATLWSIGLFRNHDHGTHTEAAAIEVWGLRDELRAGNLSVPTLFLVTADGGVWGTISDSSIETACRILGTECPLPDLP